jgi:hypothetical protein
MIKHIKAFIKNKGDWEYLTSTLKFFKYNPHAIPGIEQLLCKMGRHDYEVHSVDRTSNKVLLECFYCLHKKSSISIF